MVASLTEVVVSCGVAPPSPPSPPSPPPPSPPSSPPPPLPPYSPGVIIVPTVADLRSHLTAQTAVIVLEGGTYALGGTALTIGHDVTIQAAPGATVILDAGGGSQVLYITSGTVNLIGLDITGGSAVSAFVKHEPPPSKFVNP